jgi:N-acetylneuraminic acid mutarotase
MPDRFIRPLALVLTGLAILSCSDETTAPSPVTEETTGPALATASTAWVSKANIPGAERTALASAVVPNSAGQSVVYVIGGTVFGGQSLTNVQAYNATSNTWSWKKGLPLGLSSTNGAGVINRKIYISGGLSSDQAPRRTLFVYDPARNTWSRKRDMPRTTYAGVSGVINNKLYVLSSCYQENCDVVGEPDFNRYDPVTDRWTGLPAPEGYFNYSSGAVLGGKLYVVGSTTNHQPLLVVYNPATNSWTARAPLNRPRVTGAGVAVNGKLYVIGGFSELSDGDLFLTKTVSVYNPATNSWTNIQALPHEQAGLTASRVVVNGRARIQVFGGPRPNNLQYTP